MNELLAETIHRTDWLKSDAHSEHAITLCYQLLEELAGASPSHPCPSKAATKALCLELCYLVSRHRRWLPSKLFQETLAERITLEHQVPRSLAQPLISTLEAAFADTGDELGDLRPCHDENFIRYLLVMTLSSHDRRNLIRDLGLGESLILRIQETFDQASQTSEQPQVCGLTEVQAHLLTAAEDLGRKQLTTPWLLERELLAYRLTKLPRSLLARLHDTHLDQILGVMYTLGLGESSDQELTSMIKTQIPDLADKTTLLRTLLEQSGIIAQLGDQRDSVWGLTDLGYKLSATYFVRQQATDQSANVDKLMTINTYWLTAALDSSHLDPDQQLTILQTHMGLSSQNLEQIDTRLRENLPAEVLRSALAKHAKEGFTEESRAKARGLISTHQPSDSSQNLL